MLKSLYKLLNAVPPEERQGIHLDEPLCWKVSTGAQYFSDFLRALSELVPEGSVLYLEGGSPSQELKAFLGAKKIPPRNKVETGTIWPRPAVYHLPADKAFLIELAQRTQKCATPEVCDHLCVYKDGIVFVSGHDCLDGPLYISRQIPVETLKVFCERLGCSFEETTDMA